MSLGKGHHIAWVKVKIRIIFFHITQENPVFKAITLISITCIITIQWTFKALSTLEITIKVKGKSGFYSLIMLKNIIRKRQRNGIARIYQTTIQDIITPCTNFNTASNHPRCTLRPPTKTGINVTTDTLHISIIRCFLFMNRVIQQIICRRFTINLRVLYTATCP